MTLAFIKFRHLEAERKQRGKIFLQTHCGNVLKSFSYLGIGLSLESAHFLNLSNTVPLVVLDANLVCC